VIQTDQWYQRDRRGGLRRFACAITLLNVLGHTLLGFEQSWAQPLVAIAAGCGLELLLEWLDAGLHRRPLRFSGGPMKFIDFLLSTYITSLVVSMLLYANDRLLPIAFAAVVAIGSKSIFRIAVNGRPRHFLNPSNFGITVTLLLFPWVGIAPPYHFTENLHGIGNWILPGIIVFSGSFLNWRYTKRLPLLAAWAGVFVLQALIRHWVFDASLPAALLPMSGMAFLLFAFYMVTDPATTPSRTSAQVAFGAAVAAVYGLLVVFHVVFGFFFALSIVTLIRGGVLAARQLSAQTARSSELLCVPVPIPETTTETVGPSTVLARGSES